MVMTSRKKLTIKDYENFVDKVAEFVSDSLPEVCFYVYGSYQSRRLVPGVSDIDGGIIFNGGVVIDKQRVRLLSQAIHEAKEDLSLAIQWNLTDRKSNGDGRFLSYGSSYTDWFKRGKVSILAGPDYNIEMNGISGRSDEANSSSMNLRSLRNSLLLAYDNLEKPYDQRGSLRHSLDRAIDKLTALPKKLVVLNGGRLDERKGKAANLLQRVLPNFSSSLLDWAMNVRSSQDLFYETIHESDETTVLENLEQTVTGYEEIIDEYISRYPQE